MLGGALVGIETYVESGEIRAGQLLMVIIDQDSEVREDSGILLFRISVYWKSEMGATSDFGSQ